MAYYQEPDATPADWLALYGHTLAVLNAEMGTLWRMVTVFIPFGLVLVAGGAVPSAVGITSDVGAAILGVLFSVAAVAASFIWYGMVKRSLTYHSYWLARAREIEGKLPTGLGILQQGKPFSDGESVQVNGTAHRMEGLAKLRIRVGLALLFGSFICVSLFLVVVNLIRVSDVI